jgi:Putative zinc binding domain
MAKHGKQVRRQSTQVKPGVSINERGDWATIKGSNGATRILMEAYREVTTCRATGSDHLVPVLNLGHQVLTGVFPRSAEDAVTRGPLELVWCPDSGLLQLRHTYNSAEMYGDNYGYRSGLNQSMVDHLTNKVGFLERLIDLRGGDVVLDVGSNDGTTLKAYTTAGIHRIGIDPTGATRDGIGA